MTYQHQKSSVTKTTHIRVQTWFPIQLSFEFCDKVWDWCLTVQIYPIPLEIKILKGFSPLIHLDEKALVISGKFQLNRNSLVTFRQRVRQTS